MATILPSVFSVPKRKKLKINIDKESIKITRDGLKSNKLCNKIATPLAPPVTKFVGSINKLKTIAYENTNLLDYLKKQLNRARIYNCLDESNSTTDEIINCCEALSDCKKLIYVEKGKVYEKKFENNYK